MRKLLLPLVILCCNCFLSLRAQTISGTVTDFETGEPIFSANVIIEGTTTGTTTDFDGKFELPVSADQELTLSVSFLGYRSTTTKIGPSSDPINIRLEKSVILGQEVVVTGSRVSEQLLVSPASIEKMSLREIKSAASGDFYQSLGNYKGVDIVSSSIGFKIINTRGFAETSPFRSVQFIDGMDNQAPGLNFPVGNLVGINDLDLQSVELISGAASALYGANAFQGVVSMTSKDPFDYQGLALQLKGGSRGYIDGQWRYANALGEKERFALKFTGGYMEVEDWEAKDPEANLYGDIETDVNLSDLVVAAQFDEELTQEERDDFIALNNFLGLISPTAYPGTITIKAPGYNELDIANYNSKSLKLGAELHYKIKDSLRLSYTGRYGQGTAIYQGTNRYSINDITFNQHKLELAGKNFSLKAYTTVENAGDSYDMVFTAINISKFGITEYVSTYLGTYFDSIEVFSNAFDDDVDAFNDTTNGKFNTVESAHYYANIAATEAAFLKPGTERFDSLFNEIIDDPDLQTGSKFVDRSNLQHIEGQYIFDFIKPFDLMAGASFRRYDPQSFGTIFADTLANPGDTLPNGDHIEDADYVDLSAWEVGGYLQASKKIFNDRLNIIASLRADKSKNYDLQFSPKGSLVATLGEKRQQVVRLSAQTAFRSPTLQDQFLLIDLGPILLKGNLDGFGPVYTLESVDSFNTIYDSLIIINPSLLKVVNLDPVDPEQMTSIELGYRGTFSNKFFVDFASYFSIYNNFIGNIRVAQPNGIGVAGAESGEDAILTGDYDLFQIKINADEKVYSYGAAISASYYFGKGITAVGNYTWADLSIPEESDILPGFNTPNHKFNIGLQGRKVWKGMGFSMNYKWVGDYFWESSFGDGPVAGYQLLDAQLSYEVAEWYSTVRVGGSNLLGQEYQTAYGSPNIGRFLYASYTFDIGFD